ncbi:MAG: PTS sugar transporter subunit IIC [Clostridiaceae bacterium]|nr:PTS sugar transporter subunit IIC [Clostridiaceae bacterium]
MSEKKPDKHVDPTPEKEPELKGVRAYFKKQDIQPSFQRIGIKALGGMAHGLFASLLIGTIINTLGSLLGIPFLNEIGGFATGATGAAMAVAIAYNLNAPHFILYSVVAVGMAANSLGGAGGPLAVFFITLIAVFVGKLVSKRTPIDLIVTPLVTIIVGVAAAYVLAPPIGKAAASIGYAVMWATEQQPFIMGLLVSGIMGITLTLPISSAAVAASFGLVGLAGGAAHAGCAAHMVGFAVASYRENKVGGLAAQGLGTSMLQIPNLLPKPTLWIPAVAASLVNGPVATLVFKLKQNGAPISSGMGTSGLVGPIGIVTGWYTPSENALAMGEAAILPTAFDWIGLVVISLVIPALVALIVSELMRKKGLITLGDYKIEV